MNKLNKQQNQAVQLADLNVGDWFGPLFFTFINSTPGG